MSNITHADTLSAYTDNPATGISKTDWNTAHTVAFVGAKAYATATQTISTGTETAIIFDSEEFDTDGFHDNSTNTSRFTIPSGKAGKYLITASGLRGIAGSPEANFRLNGTTYLRGGGVLTGSVNVPTVAIQDMAVGDYVEVVAFQASGGDQTWGHATVRQSQWAMSIQWLGT